MSTNRHQFLPATMAARALVAGVVVVATWLGSPAAAVAEETTANAPLDSLEAVNSRMRIGAQIFLDPGHTEEEIQMHFARMKEVGLTVARMFIIWDHVERKQGEWNFDLYDKAYDAAAANGISVLATLCPEDPPGWLQMAPFYHSKLLLNEPELCEPAKKYIRSVVTHFKDHPAQGPWSLANEPAGLAERFNEGTLRQFGQWLKRKYGTVEKVNERWFRPIESFEKVNIGPEILRGHWVDYATLLDWKWFRVQQQSDQLRWVSDQIRLYDKIHPTHANPSALAYNMPARGADLWSQKEVFDFAGTTIHPSWQVDYHRETDVDLGTAFITDLLRSGSGGAPWWITEMQSGPALFSGRLINPMGSMMTRWLWDDIGAGAKGVIFWCWHPRRFGREAGEFGLVNADASPTPRSEAIVRLTKALAGPAAFLHRAEPLPARVAILYSRPALMFGAIDERYPRDGDRVMLSLLGCHRALCERQIPVQFINEDDLERGAAKRYEVLYLPLVYVMSDETVEAVRRYVAEGGTVWADGMTAWKDELGNVRPDIPGSLTDVFGIKVDDLIPVGDAFSLTPKDEHAGAFARMPMTLRGAKVLASDAAGNPVATRHRHGKGEVIFFATAMTLGHHKHPDAQSGDWIAAPASAPASKMRVSATTKAPRVLFRGMSCPEGLVAILTNPGAEASVRVTFRGDIRVIENVLAKQRIKAVSRNGAIAIDVKVPAGGVTVLLARTKTK
jgi:beta-galactosidase